MSQSVCTIYIYIYINIYIYIYIYYIYIYIYIYKYIYKYIQMSQVNVTKYPGYGVDVDHTRVTESKQKFIKACRAPWRCRTVNDYYILVTIDSIIYRE